MAARDPVAGVTRDSAGRDARRAPGLAPTVRQDGHGGVADDLTGPAGLTARVRSHPGTGTCTADAAALAAVRAAAPSPADASCPPPSPKP
ncbi:hypothetical protein [Streptomyces cinereospinus]|uniref:Uncharacterized protein n=1 Tax=Streptomyces cinereospinus TaxID=285561 RepID=A0ABV5N1H2_9ACTN